MSKENPFTLEDNPAYQRWKQEKLADYPTELESLVVTVEDPFHLTPDELAQLHQRIKKTNMVLYRLTSGSLTDVHIPLELLRQLGGQRLDHHLGAEPSGASVISTTTTGDRSVRGYIPYSTEAIKWHTDGYYNSPERQVNSMALHCAQNAATGGESEVMDHEILYISLRDENPDWIRVLMRPDVMTIPARQVGGKEVRPDQSGPVFSVDPKSGLLHMRYTARTRSIRWLPEAAEAVEAIGHRLKTPSPYLFRFSMEPGWGLVCNNVLHNRTSFKDKGGEATPRTLYRVRCFDRLE